LKGYDYTSAGWYFVTICVHNRECLFGRIADEKMELNEFGKIVEYTWNDLPNHNSNIILDNFVIMPNHIHGIVKLINDNSVEAGSEPAPTTTKQSGRTRRGLSEIVRQFKTFSAIQINKIRNMTGNPLWQRNFYERIIRDEQELNHIRQYIINNPIKWQDDRFHTG
jgi:REP element-mobilizing transposase RayT